MIYDERSCHQSGRPACPCMCNISIILWQIDEDIQVLSQHMDGFIYLACEVAYIHTPAFVNSEIQFHVCRQT